MILPVLCRRSSQMQIRCIATGKDAVWNVIKEKAATIGVDGEDVKKLRGTPIEGEQKIQLLLAVTEALGISIPEDRVLSEMKTVGQLADALSRSAAQANAVDPPKGIPALELFAGQALPPNVTLINYRKKRWSDEIADQFVRKAYERAEQQ